MKLFCCYTPAHEVLFRDYFKPTIPNSFELQTAIIELEGAGDFLSPEFIRCICRKIELIMESVRANSGGAIIWSDIDIQFFDITPEALLSQLGDHDIAFQPEGPRVKHVNTGFFICRCNDRVLRFFEKVRDGLQASPGMNEQYIINLLLEDAALDLSWTYLPFSYYARTHGWPPPRQLSLYHANATPGKGGVARKIQQFKELAFVRRFGFPAVVLTSIKYVPKRLWRVLSERLARAS